MLARLSGAALAVLCLKARKWGARCAQTTAKRRMRRKGAVA
jgi:hypothetical protein